MDICLQQLLPRLGTTGRRLWVADEQVDAGAVAQAPAGVLAMTNRCDVQHLLQARGIDCVLNDFDLDACLDPAGGSDEPFDAIGFRVAKEKPVVHHVINAALQRLRPGGWLWLVGEKNEGIRTYVDKAAARAGTRPQLERDGARLLAGIQCGTELGAALDDRDYPQWRQLPLAPELTVWSKPGIFGWQKLDAGSAFLIEHLHAVFPQSPKRVLDLGCGYGYLTLMAARCWQQAHFTATDNNITAVEACARNLRDAGIPGEATCSDAGDRLEGGFDVLLCNPPFHQGFDVESDLTEKFIAAAARLLAPGGRALFVVNLFIALETRAQHRFRRVDVVARNRSFKLVALER